MVIHCIHHRSRQQALLAGALSLCALIVAQIGIVSLWGLGEFEIASSVVIAVLGATVFGAYAWKISRQRKDFVCLLTDDRITCTSPDEGVAQSFDIALDRITKLITRDVPEGYRLYAIVTREGELATLTYRFSNPAHAFFNGLRALRPLIPVERG